ncbi:hypothetical protein [Caballeronia temeraria]|uniref:hypothetical protein n=1 Tax=Caballeronia temeraria TaxID=1777137 RepID=UPI0014289C0E|nr:hypothetical protein [Caballeronia temeraria]
MNAALRRPALRVVKAVSGEHASPNFLAQHAHGGADRDCEKRQTVKVRQIQPDWDARWRTFDMKLARSRALLR